MVNFELVYRYLWRLFLSHVFHQIFGFLWNHHISRIFLSVEATHNLELSLQPQWWWQKGENKKATCLYSKKKNPEHAAHFLATFFAIISWLTSSNLIVATLISSEIPIESFNFKDLSGHLLPPHELGKNEVWILRLSLIHIWRCRRAI